MTVAGARKERKEEKKAEDSHDCCLDAKSVD